MEEKLSRLAERYVGDLAFLYKLMSELQRIVDNSGISSFLDEGSEPISADIGTLWVSYDAGDWLRLYVGCETISARKLFIDVHDSRLKGYNELFDIIYDEVTGEAYSLFVNESYSESTILKVADRVFSSLREIAEKIVKTVYKVVFATTGGGLIEVDHVTAVENLYREFFGKELWLDEEDMKEVEKTAELLRKVNELTTLLGDTLANALRLGVDDYDVFRFMDDVEVEVSYEVDASERAGIAKVDVPELGYVMCTCVGCTTANCDFTLSSFRHGDLELFVKVVEHGVRVLQGRLASAGGQLIGFSRP